MTQRKAASGFAAQMPPKKKIKKIFTEHLLRLVQMSAL